MKIPVDKLTRAFKMGASVKKDSDTPVRVSVYLDSSASRFLAETVRDAFVPQTTSGIVRVERLGRSELLQRPIPMWCWCSRAAPTAWKCRAGARDRRRARVRACRVCCGGAVYRGVHAYARRGSGNR